MTSPIHNHMEIAEIILQEHPGLGFRGLHHSDLDVPVWSAVLYDPHLPEGQDEVAEVALEDHYPVVYTSWTVTR